MTEVLGRNGAHLTMVVRDASVIPVTVGKFQSLASVVRCDLSQPQAVADLLRRTRPAVVFNLAGYGVDPAERDEAEARALNSDLVTQLADTMASLNLPDWNGQRVVHTGSALEYGTAGGNLSETTKGMPTTTYGRTKLAGTLALETAGRTLGLRCVTARLFTVYGPGEHGHRLLPTLLDSRDSNGPILLTSGLQQRDFTFVDDVVDGLLRLGSMPVPPGAIVNLATGHLTSVRDFAERAAVALGLQRSRLEFGAIAARPEEMRHEPVSITRLQTLTGWSPSVDIEDGVLLTERELDAGLAGSELTENAQR